MALGTRTIQSVMTLFVVSTGAVATNLVFLQSGSGGGRYGGLAYSDAYGLETAAIVAAEMAEGAANARMATPEVHQRLIVTPPGASDSDTIRAIQSALNAKGYTTGGTDGVSGPVTQAAILAYETDQGLMLTAEPSERLLHLIVRGDVPIADRVSASSMTPGPKADALIRRVQDALASLGYKPGASNGRLGAETVTAIRAFERQNNLPDTGRISGDLVARLFVAARDVATAR
ncbi:MAG: peptidoglycan-binding domain-containing protein [Hyphomicrobium sp.]|nr:peptidoglycan-binding domain-containing protein [Hyphomicrobium sp.]